MHERFDGYIQIREPRNKLRASQERRNAAGSLSHFFDRTTSRMSIVSSDGILYTYLPIFSFVMNECNDTSAEHVP